MIPVALLPQIISMSRNINKKNLSIKSQNIYVKSNNKDCVELKKLKINCERLRVFESENSSIIILFFF